MRTPLALLSLFVSLCLHALAVDIPAGGQAMFSGTPPSGFGFWGPNATRTEIAVADIPPTKGWRISTTADAKARYEIQLSGNINRAVSKGDSGLIHFYARTVSSPKDPLGLAQLGVVVHKNSADWTQDFQTQFFVSKDWKEYAIPFKWQYAYASGASALVFEFGFSQQEVEIAGVQLYYYGTAVAFKDLPRTTIGYPGNEENAAWRTAALARIDALRKGELNLQVTDESGAPIPGVTVTVEMVNHHFQFGSAVDFSRLLSDTEENRWYKRTFFSLFNGASPENDMKWQPLAGDWGASWSFDRARAGLRFLANHSVPTRGHVMVWPGKKNLPKAIVDLIGTTQQSTIPGLVLKHIDEVAELSKGLVEEWDVQNEPFDNRDLLDIFGDKIAADWFKRAREKLPGVRLYLNDFDNESKYDTASHFARDIEMIRVLKENNAPLDAFGLQAHIKGSGVPPQYYLDTLDAYAAEGLKLRVTEFDIETLDEAEQAQYARDFLIASFSHPAMLGFQFWGFWEGAHWIEEGAMFRLDRSEKPMATAVRQLIHNEWKTKVTQATNASGRLSTRAFYGDYVATIDYNGQRTQRKFKHRPEALADVTMTVTPPRLGNISTRGLVGGNKGELHAGVRVEGPNSKRVLFRFVGPRLEDWLPGKAVKSTRLDIYNMNNPSNPVKIASNDGWMKGNNGALMRETFAKVGAFDLRDNSLDSALIIDLPGNSNYTALGLSGDGSEGIGLIEAYEIDSSDTVFYNLSTRGHAEDGDGVLIGGIAVYGRNARTYLIRAAGPSLPDIVPNRMSRPVLTLYRGEPEGKSSVIYANTGWQSSQDLERMKVLFPKVGAFAFKEGSADAAMLVTLEPNPQNYTVQVSGMDSTVKGTVLLEIYEVRVD